MSFKHGEANPSNETYTAWKNMKQRCLNQNNPAFKNYGGRGISFAPDWNDFTVFLKDMGYRPAGLTLERIDNERGYYKENCKWATLEEQSQNRRAPKTGKLQQKGITKDKRGFRVRVTEQGRRQSLGVYSSLTEALEVRDNFKKAPHGTQFPRLD